VIIFKSSVVPASDRDDRRGMVRGVLDDLRDMGMRNAVVVVGEVMENVVAFVQVGIGLLVRQK
jgi:hypothetical protein